MPRHESPPRAQGRKEHEKGNKRFKPAQEFQCKIHSQSEHYSITGRCCECTRLAKSNVEQKEYWDKNKESINARRRKVNYQSIIGVSV